MINFSNPLNGRKWLMLLETHSKFGMLFKKKLSYKKKYLGFSFKSNKFGLRGPDNINASTVICGTSFAMGLSVDNGKNWYELDERYKFLFNIGMPIGFKQHASLLNEYYKGDFNTLILIYHPNIWVTNKNFFRAESRNTDIFTAMKWSIQWHKVLYLYIRWLIKENVKIILNQKIILKLKTKKFHLNLKYSYFPIDDIKIVDRIMDDFKKLYRPFKKVIIYKVPIKEEVAVNMIDNSNLQLLNENYQGLWNIFKKKLDSYVEIIDLTDQFEMIDYLEKDTHWSEKGNMKFHKLVQENKALFND